jgi:N-acetylmuramoyl-L-alanine amidase
MKARGTITRVLAGAGLVLVCAVAAASVVLRVLPRGNLAAAARRRAAAQPGLVVPLPAARTRGVTAPWHVGIQAGHWQIDQLPDEQYRLRGDTGAQWGRLTESAVNLEIARRVVLQLQHAGVAADLLPALVPAGYDADAFVAIHADDGAGTETRGWKISTPWRASEASRRLRDDIAHAYSQASGLPEDRYGVSFNMRGYYAFSWYRYEHAVAPTTPAAIIETGFLTSASDREVIVEDPDRAARGISDGVIAFLAELAKLPDTALAPVMYPPMEVAADNAALRYFPDPAERVRTRLAAGTRVRPVNEENGWTEIIVWGNYRVFGWMKDTDLAPLSVE